MTKSHDDKVAEVKKLRAAALEGQDPAQVAESFTKMMEVYQKGWSGEFSRAELKREEVLQLINHTHEMRAAGHKMVAAANKALDILKRVNTRDPESLGSEPHEVLE